MMKHSQNNKNSIGKSVYQPMDFENLKKKLWVQKSRDFCLMFVISKKNSKKIYSLAYCFSLFFVISISG